MKIQYRNGYIGYRQAFFPKIEKNTFSFLNLTAKIKQYNMIIITRKLLTKWLCPNDQSPFEEEKELVQSNGKMTGYDIRHCHP